MPEQARLQEAIRGLVTLATIARGGRARVARPGRRARRRARPAVYDDARARSSRTLRDTVERRRAVRDREEPALTFVAWTSPYAPFFGEDELRALHTIAGADGDRARPRAPVRAGAPDAARARARERADDELRRARRARAADAGDDDPRVRADAQPPRRPARRGAEGRAARRARAADASHGGARRAAARPVAPRRGSGRRPAAGRRPRAAAPTRSSRSPRRARADEVEVDVPEQRERASSIRTILDHIVTNLVTNAFRYGQSPVRVTATARERPAAGRGRGLGPGRRARDRGDAVRPLHARRRRARPGRRHRARARDRARLRAGAPRRPSLRARRSDRRALRGRSARRLAASFTAWPRRSPLHAAWPAPECLPVARARRLRARRARARRETILSYGPSSGYGPLREWARGAPWRRSRARLPHERLAAGLRLPRAAARARAGACSSSGPRTTGR